MIKDIFNPLKMLRNAEDIIIPELHKRGFFDLDNKIRQISASDVWIPFSESIEIAVNLLNQSVDQSVLQKLDDLGVSNKARLNAYNERHPNDTLSMPYLDEFTA